MSIVCESINLSIIVLNAHGKINCKRMYVGFKNVDFKLNALLDHKHNIETLTLAYRVREYNMLPLLDMTTHMEMIDFFYHVSKKIQ